MSNVSIYDKNWLDLVFDGKNKEYGAYQLRQQNSRTTLMALFMGIGFFAGIAGIGSLVSSFSSGDVITQPIIPDSPPIEVTEVHLGDKPEVKKAEPAAAAPQIFEEPTNLSNMVVAQTALAVEVPTNENAVSTQSSGETNSTGVTPTAEGGNGTVVAATVPTVGGDGPVDSGDLDRLPLFPGGIDKFYTYIISNISNPEDVSDDESSVKVLMSFVVERDGSMTDIKVLKSSNYSLEKEAIRVLKSLRVKWTPGIKDHEKVRTLYKLPITVKL